MHPGAEVRNQVYSPEEREIMLQKMRATAEAFYWAAFRIGCHPFIELAGLMNEYVKVAQRAHSQGIDFNVCSVHSGIALPIETYEAAYIGEKLGCIYGPAMRDPVLANHLLAEMGLKAAV